MCALLPVLAAAAILVQGPDPIDADIAWVASGKFCEPETVLPLPDNTLLVSNVCGFGEPGSGFLSLLDAQGQILDWRIVGGLDAPLGMALLGDLLHLVDNNRLKKQPQLVQIEKLSQLMVFAVCCCKLDIQTTRQPNRITLNIPANPRIIVPEIIVCS
jgi:hypothetical protein